MNTDSVDGRRITNPSENRECDRQHGDFAWEFDFTHFDHGAKESDERLTLYFCLPGEKHWSPIHVTRDHALENKSTWWWDGNLDKPTTTPSILRHGHWHGYLTAGRFVSC